jgi:UDP-glucuronate 4-epimerase
MAPYLFTDAIARGRPIQVFNHGRMRRDFTFIDDVVTGVVACLDRVPPAGAGPDGSTAPYRVFNIGNNEPVELGRFIAAIESALGKKAEQHLLPMQPGDVAATCADTERLQAWVGFRPRTSIEDGIGEFVRWYLGYPVR